MARRTRRYYKLEIDSLDEISAVDRPAQPGAKAVIFKRANNRLADLDVADVGSGDPDPGTQGIEPMTKTTDAPETVTKAELEAVTKKLEAVSSELAIQKTIAGLAAPEKAHYDSLDGAGRDSFLKLDAAGRQAAIEKAKADADDSVVYTDLDGQKFTKRDDPRLVQMAKSRDEERRVNAAERAAAQKERLEKRAKDELSNCPGEPAVKVALLKAVDSIPAGAERNGVLAILKAANDALSKATGTIGSDSGDSPDAAVEAEQKLEKLATEHAAKAGISYAKAYLHVLKETPEGRELFKQSKEAAR